MTIQKEQPNITQAYYRHVDMLYRLCYSYMKNPSDTEDMVQEVFLRLLRSGMEFENERHEKAWLIVTASNLCKDNLKHWWRRILPLESVQLEDVQEKRDLEVMQAVFSLPADYKSVVYLYYYEGYSTAEIAKYLDSPESTVRSRLARARKKLQSRLGGNDDE